MNLLPFLSGEKAGPPHDALYWRFGQQMAIRVGDYKLVRYDSNADTRTGARNQPVTAAKLYRLRDDIGETKDLAAAMPDKVQGTPDAMGRLERHAGPAALGRRRRDSDGAEPGAPAEKRPRAKR